MQTRKQLKARIRELEAEVANLTVKLNDCMTQHKKLYPSKSTYPSKTNYPR